MNFNVGVGATAPKTGSGFSLPLPTTTTAAATPGFSLAAGDASSNKLAPSTTLGTGLQLQSKPAGGVSTAASTVSGFSLPPTSSFTLGAKPTTTVAAASAATAAVTAATATAAPLTLATTNVVPSAQASSSSSLNFYQLEEAINKWTLDLEEQEKVFMNQATQVNAWDRLLIANGEKIVSLNNSVERVKMEQQQLDNELDFILAQQRELEDCLVPLEKELGANELQDPEREHIYLMAENMDTQLKQMSEDLKEIIEHLNESTQTQDSNDPIVQIGRILNAHMNSLQWIDQNTALISTHLDQVTKLHDVHRRENERSFHLTYD